MIRRLLLPLILIGLLPAAAASQTVQQNLRASQQKLDSIQAERVQLQREMTALQSRVRDASRELLNIERQREVSRSALLELEFQTQILTENVESVEREHSRTQQRLVQRTLDRDARLRAIYKRGSLHSVQVLLLARSFSDLMNRYKYLHLLALYDRMIVEEVQRLERELAGQERELRESLRQLESLRTDKAMELDQLERLESQRQQTLRQFRQQETRTATRLTELEREQTQLTDAIANLERRRREEEERRTATSQPGTISTRDLGTLPWPVEGTILYRFGPDRKPDGIVLRNQGIGIGAPAGTPVRAVESGTVELAGSFPGYGQTVILSHGGGYRTLYLYLRSIQVQVGQEIRSGEMVGTVGGDQSAEGPHIEFQVRIPRGSTIEPVDPLVWLRARAGS